MVELPETYVLADQINRTVKGKRIVRAEAGHSPHTFAWYTGDPAMYHQKLAGKMITGAGILSGTTRLIVDDMSLLIGTPIRYHAQGERLPDKHQLLVEFEDSTVISCTVQMWGILFCYRSGEEATSIPPGHIVRHGPSPLDDRFDYDYFLGLLAPVDRAKTSAKAFLATEQRIPGLGNGVLQDILWNAYIHPKRKMSSLSEGELQRMFHATKTVLADMVARGGRDTERDLFGYPGGYTTVLSKNTPGKPCPRCGSAIKKEAYMGGSIYYCPQCQRS